MTLACGLPASASAATPGANGRLAVAKWTAPKSKKGSAGSALISSAPDGSALQRLFAKKRFLVDSPEYSADGTKIAFSMGAFGRESKSDGVYVAAADGTGAKLVARTGWVDGIAWSPDGTSLVYADVMDGIHSVPSTGGTAELIVKVLDDGGYFRRPAFTPDGATILFERNTLSSGDKPFFEVGELWKARRDGTGAGVLFPSLPMPFAGEPDVSPDGKTVVFTSLLDKRATRSAVATVPIDGSAAPRTLYTSAKNGWIDGPTWAPDGSRVAFTTGGFKKVASSLLVLDPATAATSTVQRAASAQLTGPTWQALPAG